MLPIGAVFRECPVTRAFFEDEMRLVNDHAHSLKVLLAQFIHAVLRAGFTEQLVMQLVPEKRATERQRAKMEAGKDLAAEKDLEAHLCRVRASALELPVCPFSSRPPEQRKGRTRRDWAYTL